MPAWGRSPGPAVAGHGGTGGTTGGGATGGGAGAAGRSYGMMVAVQLDHQTEFDRLWQFVKKHMANGTGEIAWDASVTAGRMFFHNAIDSNGVIGTYATKYGAYEMSHANGVAQRSCNALLGFGLPGLIGEVVRRQAVVDHGSEARLLERRPLHAGDAARSRSATSMSR